MKIKLPNKILFLILPFFVLMLAGSALAVDIDFADYDCTIDYGNTSLSNPAYDGCCPDYGDTAGLMIDGAQCPESDRILFKPDNNTSASCISTSVLQAKIDEAVTKNRAKFNCLKKTLEGNCRAGDYNQCGDTCYAVSAALKATCDGQFRNVNCSQTACGGCFANYTYCGLGGNVCQLKKVGPNMIYGDTPTYTNEQIASGEVTVDLATDVYSCDQIGKNVIDDCQGTCSDCPDGTTESGRNEFQCVTYGERFAEIFSDGLTSLGGPLRDGVYDYSDTAPDTYSALSTKIQNYMSGVHLKADVAETLNWDSDTLPPVIQELINHYYYTCAEDADCPEGDMLCADGGICYTPGSEGDPGSTCSNDSDCNLGLICGANDICMDPDESVGEAYFVGLSATAVNGDRNGYANANAECSGAHAESHICTSREIINSYVFGASALNGQTEIAWINVGAPGNIIPAVSDCKGWENNANSPYYGTVWNFNLKSPGLQPCGATKKFACCR